MFTRNADAGTSAAPGTLATLARFGGGISGLTLASAIAVAAMMLAPFTPLSAVPLALLGGLLLSSRARHPMLQPGIAIGAKSALRIGVALLGAQLSFAQLRAIGVEAALVAVAALVLTLAIGLLMARRLGLTHEIGWLTAGAVSICGASATLAIAASLPKSRTVETNAAACVAAITVVGTAGMLLYPYLAQAAGLDSRAAGIFLGASLHEVVQAVGAGFAVSDEAGELATTAKLVRVACLGPVVLLVGWSTRKRMVETNGTPPPLVPGFLAAFVLLAILASAGAIPSLLLPILGGISRFCLLIAIAALGLRLSLPALTAFGWRGHLALIAQTCLIASLSLAGVLVMGIG